MTQQVQADTQSQNSDFEIQPITPEGQIDASKNYYDVEYKPGSTHTIEMRIQNFTNHKITVKSELQNGMTQQGGGLKYQTTTSGLDESLRRPLTTFASVEKADRILHLGPKETTVIQAHIKMPNEKFSGVIAGSWHFIEYLNNGKNNSQSVSSNYAYETGIILRGSHYKVYPELKYDSSGPILVDNRPAMGIKLRNTQAMLLKKVHVKAVVTKKGLFSDKRLFENSDTSIAPNSSAALPVAWNYDDMKPGKYEVTVKVTGENLWNKLPMTWTFKKTFKISKKSAMAINKKAIQRPSNKWLYAFTASGVMLLVAAASLYKVTKLG
ncbi:DUF916 and DUF3324 domain-containing protein [Latilactobacillus curvatus]